MTTVPNSETTEGLKLSINIDERRVNDHLKAVVRSTVEETLNAMLDAEDIVWKNHHSEPCPGW